MNIIKFISDYWEVLSPIALELLLRLFPTKKNYSIIDGVFKIISAIIPNIRKNKTVNIVILFMLCSNFLYAQLNTNTRIVKFNAVQTATDTTTNAQDGWLWYDAVSEKFRARVDGVNITVAPATSTPTEGQFWPLNAEGTSTGGEGFMNGDVTIYAQTYGVNILDAGNFFSNGLQFNLNYSAINIESSLGGIAMATGGDVNMTGASVTIDAVSSSASLDGVNTTITSGNNTSVSGTNNLALAGSNSQLTTTNTLTITANDIAVAQSVPADNSTYEMVVANTSDEGAIFNMTTENNNALNENGITAYSVSTLTSNLPGFNFNSNRGRIGIFQPGVDFKGYEFLDVLGTSAFNFYGLHFFNPTSAFAGLNVGMLAGDPASVDNGDLWYNNTTGNLRARINNISKNVGSPAGNSTEIQFNTSGQFATNGGLRFSGGQLQAPELNTPSITTNPSTSLTISPQATLNLNSQFGGPINVASDGAINITSGNLGNLNITSVNQTEIISQNNINVTTTAGGTGTIFRSGSNTSTISIAPATGRIVGGALTGFTSGGESSRDIAILTTNGEVSLPNGNNVFIRAGNGFSASGNGNGGNINILSGQRRIAGTGTDGNVIINTLNGELIFTITRINCTGAPSGAVFKNAGILSICP